MASFKRITKKPELIVLSFLLLFRIAYFFSSDYRFLPDSHEYITRDGFAWLHGSIDRYRLPVYPMLIDICQSISESNFVFILCLIQFLMSLLSIFVMFWTLKKLTDKKWVGLIVTFLYATFNATVGWDKTILTESLSISLSAFIIFGIISYIKDKKYRYVILTTVCLLIGCFLRAVFSIYAGLFFGFLILITIFPGENKEKSITAKLRRVNLKSALIAFVPIILVFAYAFTFNSLYGGFTLSDSGLGQQLYLMLETEYYKDTTDVEIKEIAESILNSPANSLVEKNLDEFVDEFYENSDVSEKDVQQIKNQMLSLHDNTLNEALEKRLDEYLLEEYSNKYNCSFTEDTYLARLYIMENFDRSRIVEFVNEAKRNNLISYITKIPRHLFDPYTTYSSMKLSALPLWITRTADNMLFFLKFTLLHTLIISLIEIVSFFVSLIKKKKVDWIRLGLGVYLLATVFLAIFGTNADFARTAVTALPFMFVAIAIYIEWFYNYLTKREPKFKP